MPNASNTDGWWRRSGARTSPPAGRSSPCRAPTPGRGWAPSPPRRRPSVASGWRRLLSPARTAPWPAPATRARTASSWRCRPTPPRRCGRRCWSRAGAGRSRGRDTLRLEAGLPLHGHEWARGSRRCRPGWAGWWLGTSRAGSGAGSPSSPSGSTVCAGGCGGSPWRAGVRPRAEQGVLVDGAPAGETTSGNFRPCWATGSPSAFLPPEVDEGTEVAIDVRGTRCRRRSCRPRSSPLTDGPAT